MAKNVLLGVKKFTAKSGKNYEVMVLVSDVDARAAEGGSFGKLVDELFIPDNCLGRLTPADIGKEVILDYEIKGGRAYLIGFDIKK